MDEEAHAEIAMTVPNGGTIAGSERRVWPRIMAITLLIAGLLLVGRQLGSSVPRFAEWVQSLGVWGPAGFIAGYVVATVALVPGTITTLIAGAIFGLWRGTAYVFIGAAAGSILAFLISRYVARSAVQKRLERNLTFRSIDRAVADQGLKITILLRLSPLFPFNVLNYALGLTSVRLRDYALASLGMLPGTFLYVYYGKLAGDLAALAGGAAVRKGAGYWSVLILGLVATVAVTAIVTRIARNALKEYE
jgi:uncharacterized membrane protein YdjX (TVP38/TMEM64 family)